MITRVRLRNWRAFRQLDTRFGPGLSFVVATNAVGKTSLVSGMHWGLFGELSGVPSADNRRDDTEPVEATVELTLPDGAELIVTRRLAGKRQTLEAAVDGQAVEDEDQLNATLGASYGATATVLSHLCVMYGGPQAELAEGSDLLNRHLAAAYGVDNLQKAADEADQVAKSSARSTRDIRALEKIDVADRQSIEQELEQVGAEVEQAKGRLEGLNERLAAEKGVLDLHAAWSRHRAQLEEHARAVEALSARARGPGRDHPQPDAAAEPADPAPALGQLIDALISQLEEAERELAAETTERARLHGLLLAAQEGLGQLGEAADVCPVCQRPLDEQTVEHAHAKHRDRIDEFERQLRQLPAEEAGRQRLAALRSLLREATNLRPPVPPADPPPRTPQAEVERQLAALRIQVEEETSKLGVLRNQQRDLQRRLDEEDSVRAARAHLRRAYKKEALAVAAAQALRAVAQDVIETSIEPLEHALRERWKLLMGSSVGGLGLQSGQPVLDLGGTALDLKQLSGAEQAIAVLLTRMLVLTASTRAGFLWLDEPASHLDPRNRRTVAATLLQVVANKELEQLLVTTYEEPLVRRLVAASGQLADMVYLDRG